MEKTKVVAYFCKNLFLVLIGPVDVIFSMVIGERILHSSIRGEHVQVILPF